MNAASEKDLVLRTYLAMMLCIVIDPIFAPFDLPTAILRLTEILCFFYACFEVLQIFRLKFYFRYGAGIVILTAFLALLFIGIVARGHYVFSPKDLLMLFSSSGDSRVKVYFLPFLILFLPNAKYFDDIIKLFFKFSLLVIPLWLFSFADLVQDDYHGESVGVYLPFFSAFLLGLYPLLKKEESFVNIVIFFIYFLLMVMNARRNIVFSLFMISIIAFYCVFLSGRGNTGFKNSNIAVSILLIIGLFILMNWQSLSNSIFERIIDRATDDTRSGVEAFFLADMLSSPATDWIFGRGADGSYFQMVQNAETYEFTSDRSGIETGYLNMILKGGILYVVFILVFLFTSVIKGLKTKRRSLKYLSLFLLTYIVDMYTTNPVSYYAYRTILFWFSVSVCLQFSQLLKSDDADKYVSLP